MTIKDAEKLRPGAIVRESYRGGGPMRTGLVLAKEHVDGPHNARILGGMKYQRYDVVVHWFDGPRGMGRANPEKLQNWELMVVKHV